MIVEIRTLNTKESPEFVQYQDVSKVLYDKTETLESDGFYVRRTFLVIHFRNAPSARVLTSDILNLLIFND